MLKTYRIIPYSDVFTKYLDREAEHSKALETVDELRVKHKGAEDRMIARNAKLRQHNCTRSSTKIHKANPAFFLSVLDTHPIKKGPLILPHF
jgi:hypothetical protein